VGKEAKVMDRGDYIHTYTGNKFYAMDPKPEDINIRDIAHALSNLCRFGGHSPIFYSVAEHSVLVSEAVPVKDALWGLLHDASEAYLCDIPRPFKQYLTNYKELEERIQRAIGDAFNLPWPIPEPVHFIDRNIVATEANQLWESELEWTKDFEKINTPIRMWDPEQAEWEFLETFHRLTNNDNSRN
jgi:hypothetical protein